MLNEGGQKRYVNVKKFLQMTQEYHGFRSMWFALFAAMFYGLIANYHYEFPGDTFTQGSVMDLWTSTEDGRSVWDVQSFEESGQYVVDWLADHIQHSINDGATGK